MRKLNKVTYTVDDIPCNKQEVTALLSFVFHNKKKFDFIHKKVENFDSAKLVNDYIRKYRECNLDSFYADFDYLLLEVGYYEQDQ